MALLKDAAVEHLAMEGNTPVFEGTIGIFPYRLTVRDNDEGLTRSILVSIEMLDFKLVLET